MPTILQMLLTNAEAKAVDLKGWKVIIGGSAFQRPRAALERGIDVFAGYGMSETCPILTIARVPGDPAEDLDGCADQRIRTGYWCRWSISTPSTATSSTPP